METDRDERKNRLCRMIKEECEEGGWLTNSGRERPGGVDMNVKEDGGNANDRPNGTRLLRASVVWCSRNGRLGQSEGAGRERGSGREAGRWR